MPALRRYVTMKILPFVNRNRGKVNLLNYKRDNGEKNWNNGHLQKNTTVPIKALLP
jgi:hypothetical protein